MSDIIFSTQSDSKKNQLALITLNRPAALNALNGDMFLRMQEQLQHWQCNDAIKAVVIRSTLEKAFCAGGDVRAVYENHRTRASVSMQYFELEYAIDRLITHYPKPIVPMLQGITMGGGVGISVHASHCVASENLRWAMPETLIGFFPDVGASYYLSRLSGGVGIYLALTGASINTTDALNLCLIKSVVPYHQFDALTDKLAETIYDSRDFAAISRIIAEFSVRSPLPALLPPVENISECFLFDTIEHIMNRLKAVNTPWSNEVITQLQQRSPTSLKVTLQQLQRAKNMKVDDVFDMDLHIAHRMLEHNDFYEGVRAAIVDKDKKPRWEPNELSKVASTNVDSFFI